jgi:hypothetical protein
MTLMTMGQGGGEAAPPAGGEPTAAAVIVATTILLFPFFIYQVIISRPRNKGGVTGHARNLLVNATVHCCAECGEEGDVSLKACKSCMLVRYCNADCQRNHWPKHKQFCKHRAAELRDEALFKDPPPKEDCPICFLPMPGTLICCKSLPHATILSVPIYDFAIANEEHTRMGTEEYYECCGKSICKGCVYSFRKSGNDDKCPFCNSDRADKSDEESIEEMMRRVEANDAGAICQLGSYYFHGILGLQQDQERAKELWTQAAKLGSSKANFALGRFHDVGGGDLKKAKFHYETAAMAGHELARYNLGIMEGKSGNAERGVKHLKIAASAGNHYAMHCMITLFTQGAFSKKSIDSTLAAYNNSCVEMRSEARDAYIKMRIDEQ